MTPDYASALEFLYGRIDYERTSTIPYQEKHLKLQRMRVLLEKLGDPQRDLAIVHIAGTKGKGSVGTMVAAILNAAGLSTGLYSSPHLVRLEERIRINGDPCLADDIVGLTTTLKPIVLQLDEDSSQVASLDPSDLGRPTYFEIMTAMALLHFQRQGVDYVVLEVGLGGRLDSTNVCSPLATVITSISLDHTKQLGDTVDKIAAEKAGILKPGIPLVSGVRSGPARETIERIAESQKPPCPILTVSEDFDFEYSASTSLQGSFDYIPANESLGPPLKAVGLGMLGRHQAANAALATTVVRLLATQRPVSRQPSDSSQMCGLIDDQAIRNGLLQARCPARIEVLSTDPYVVLDAAHNRASIAALFDVLDESFADRDRILVLGTTSGKDVAGMLERIVGNCAVLICTQYISNPRSYSAKKLCQRAAAIPTVKQTEVLLQADPQKAWQLALSQSNPESLICVTGSFFLAAELRPTICDQFG